MPQTGSVAEKSNVRFSMDSGSLIALVSLCFPLLLKMLYSVLGRSGTHAAAAVIIIARLREAKPMTMLEVMFRYGMPPGEKEMSALGKMYDVYGIRRLQFN